MASKIYEVVKEYLIRAEGVVVPVKARILDDLNEPSGSPFKYRWEISHYCQPTEEADGVYYPTRTQAPTLSDAEWLLKQYARIFTHIKVTPNKNY